MSSLAAAVPHLSERNIVKAPSFTGATKWEQFAGTLYISHANYSAILFLILLPLDFMFVAYYYYDLNRARLPHAYKQKPKIPIIGKDPALDDNKDDDEDDSSAPPQLYAVAFWVINFFFLGYTIVCGTGLKQINKRLEPAVSSKAAYNQVSQLDKVILFVTIY